MKLQHYSFEKCWFSKFAKIYIFKSMLIRWLLYLKLPKWVGSKIPMKHFEVNGRFKREGMFITT